MTEVLYFAYGSNMLTERLAARCSSARAVGVAVAEGYGLSFGKRSVDGSGKAMLVEGAGRGGGVPGVLFALDPREVPALDLAEGVGHGYRRADRFTVRRAEGGAAVAFVYLAEPGHVDAALQPYDWYRALVLAGALQHGLPEAWRHYVEGLAFRHDPEPERPTRLAGVRALELAGYRHLLR